jgi:integrase
LQINVSSRNLPIGWWLPVVVGNMTRLNASYLVKRKNGIYWATVTVPKPVRAIIGKAHLRKSLGTSNLTLANEYKGVHVTAFLKQIRTASRKHTPAPAADTLEAEALRYRISPEVDGKSEAIDQRVEEIALYDDGLNDDEVYGDRQLGPKSAAFHAVAHSLVTPVLLLLPDFIKWYKGHTGTARTKGTIGSRDYAINALAAWMRTENLAPNVEEVNRRVVAKWRQSMMDAGAARATINRAIGSARLYWRWLVDAGHIPEGPNPWDRQDLAKADSHNDEEEVNAYTNSELVTLFTHPRVNEFRDAMMLAAYSGARRLELFSLTVGDCAHGFFNIKKSKTKSGIRLVPIHSKLLPVVEKLTAGKGPNDSLLADRVSAKKPGEAKAGDPYGKRFSRWRADLLPNSKTNFHSFRHGFARALRVAGVPESTAGQLLGHSQGLTYGRYGKLRSHEMTPEQFKALHAFLSPEIEKVRLPTGCL